MADWKITEEHKQKMSEFMADLWSLVKASYEMPPENDKDTTELDHYWTTLCKWADALSTKYGGDPVINGMILGYMEGQSDKSVGIVQNIKTDTT